MENNPTSCLAIATAMLQYIFNGMNVLSVGHMVKYMQASTPATKSKAMQANKKLTQPDCGLQVCNCVYKRWTACYYRCVTTY